jgi:hypothetical protein
MACWLQKRCSAAEEADAVPYRAGEEQRGKRFDLTGIVVTATAAVMMFRSRNRGRGLGSPNRCPAEPPLPRLAAAGYGCATAGAPRPILCPAEPPLPCVTRVQRLD